MVFRISILWLIAVALVLTGGGIEWVTGLGFLNSIMVAASIAVATLLGTVLWKER